MKIMNIISIMLIISIMSGCIGQQNTIMGSSVTSKLAISEKSGIFSEKAITMGHNNSLLSDYKVIYNNGDTLSFSWGTSSFSSTVSFIIKSEPNNYEYSLRYYNGRPSSYLEGDKIIMWTTDGRVDPSKSTGDINNANEFIKITNIIEEDIRKRFESGQLKAITGGGVGI